MMSQPYEEMSTQNCLCISGGKAAEGAADGDERTQGDLHGARA